MFLVCNMVFAFFIFSIVLECILRIFTYSAIFLVVMCTIFWFIVVLLRSGNVVYIHSKYRPGFLSHRYRFIFHHIPMLYQHVSLPKHDRWAQLGRIRNQQDTLGCPPSQYCSSQHPNQLICHWHYWKGGGQPLKDTADGSDIRRSPVEVGSLSHYFPGFDTS